MIIIQICEHEIEMFGMFLYWYQKYCFMCIRQRCNISCV